MAYNAVILAEFDGTVQFDAITEGVTYREESDEQTGHREKVIIESKAKDQNPSIIVRPGKKGDAEGQKGYSIPVGSH